MYYRRLRDLREDHDLKQKEVAHLLDIDQRVYSNYETGAARSLPFTACRLLWYQHRLHPWAHRYPHSLRKTAQAASIAAVK